MFIQSTGDAAGLERQHHSGCLYKEFRVNVYFCTINDASDSTTDQDLNSSFSAKSQSSAFHAHVDEIKSVLGDILLYSKKKTRVSRSDAGAM